MVSLDEQKICILLKSHAHFFLTQLAPLVFCSSKFYYAFMPVYKQPRHFQDYKLGSLIMLTFLTCHYVTDILLWLHVS